ncbi:MAG: hypothetical protein IJR35_00795 [Synergistaceae bacterium]|nr:hypothetical protein [Synergistaceae bacterium]
MTKKFWLSVIIFLLATCSCTYCADNFIELRIPCEVNSQVKAVMPSGEIINLGRVLMIPVKTNWPAYTASKWSEPSSVCATAVNAIHMLINTEENRGRIISIVPSVTIAPAAVQGAFFSFEMEAGTGIFGGFAPLTGSRVTLEHDGAEHALTGVPENGDVLIIRTAFASKFFMAEIENRQGGRVIIWDKDGWRLAARVIHPVNGVGRFGGTLYQARGRIRASHSGVIDVATSKRGEVGGIQIMPLKHALTSKEMLNAWNLTQWMIIAPLPGNSDLEGSEPLYKSSLVPGTQLSDSLPDIWSQYGRKPLVICRRNGGEWEKLPEVSGRVDDALKDITHLRIYYPSWREPLN